MNKSLKCIISFFICSISIHAFADNTVTMRMFVYGDAGLSHKAISGSFVSANGSKYRTLLDSISLGTDFSNIEKQHNYRKHTNKIISRINTLGSGKIIPDISCRTGVFKVINTGNKYTTIKVNNKYKKTSVDWTVDYDIRARVGEPITLSCYAYAN